MFSIPIYKKEKEDGLTELIISKASLSYNVDIVPCNQIDYKPDISKTLLESLKANSDNGTIDLYPLRSILVTTCWNENDDVFDVYETWAARNTGKDKPFNYEHDCNDIIGHLTSSYPVDDDGNILNDNLSVDELPKRFHVANNAVIYKYWNKADKQDRINKILEEIPKGLWQVSVEALFSNFDYAIRDNDGNVKIIARNSDTAFLTKHLKAYKGTGIYDNCKIGRVPRNMIFSGKGLTQRPANSESIIFAKKFDINVSPSILLGYTNKEEVKIMSETNRINDLEKENKELKDSLTKLQASINAGEVQKLSNENESLKKTLKEINDKLSATETNLTNIQNELKASKDNFEKVSKEYVEAKAKLEKIENDQKHKARVELVVSKLGFDQKKSDELVSTLASLTDEAFTKVIELQAKPINQNQDSVNTNVATEKILEQATNNKASDKSNVALTASVGVDNQVEKVRTDIVSFLNNSENKENK